MEILNAVETELEGSGNRIGYRQMRQRLRNKVRSHCPEGDCSSNNERIGSCWGTGTIVKTI